jgi:hypothetical protein
MSTAALSYESTLPVLGVRVRLRSDAQALIGAFEESLGRWRVMERHADLLSEEVVEGTLLLDPGDESVPPPVPVQYTMQEQGRMVISTPRSVVRGDPAARAFEGRVTRALLGEGPRFRYKVLEAVILSVVTRLDRQPLHASVIVRDGAALLLAGPSGTGKSTLSYAAARAGLEVLSEDTVFAQLQPTLRLWGMPGSVHLPAAARRHFAELERASVRTLPTGKAKISVSLASLGAEASLPFVERAGICVVERTSGAPVSAEPLAAAGVESALRRQLEPGFDLFDDERGELARALAPAGGWRLVLNDDPAAAIPVIHRLLDRVEERAGRASSW